MLSQALFLLPVVISLTQAFPNGAHNNGSNPMDALSSYCTAGNFRPNHGSYMPQASPSPYVIKVTSPQGSMYSPNQPVTITIEGISQRGGPAKKFKGFFLQGDSTEGSFGGDLVCNKGQGKAVTFCSKLGVTHTNPLRKSRVVCKWTPPDFQLGQVQFTATVVENFTDFWTGVKSEVTLYSDPSTMTYVQKAQQMSQNLMKQWQGTSQSLMTAFKQSNAGNAIANMFGANAGGTARGNAGNNPFASLMSSFGKTGGAATTAASSTANQFASLMNSFGKTGGAAATAATSAASQLARRFGGTEGNSQGGDVANYWTSLTRGNQRQAQNTNQGYDLNNFRQFFQR